MDRMALLVLALAACTTSTEPTTTTSTVATTSTTEETTTTTRLEECAAPPYEVTVLPEKVSATSVDVSEIPIDAYAEVPGTSSTIWVDAEGALAVVLVRGTLPLEQWPGESGEVEIDGARARVGPFADGSWVVGWFEPPGDRCDQFTMVFYPPIEGSEVQATLASMNRVAG